jgi:uncharacterized membrane protein YtjA (UPF0391 family)
MVWVGLVLFLIAVLAAIWGFTGRQSTVKTIAKTVFWIVAIAVLVYAIWGIMYYQQTFNAAPPVVNP